MNRLLVVPFLEHGRFDFHESVKIVALANREMRPFFDLALAPFAQRQSFAHQNGRGNVSSKKMRATDEKGIQVLLCGKPMINVRHQLVNKLRDAVLLQEGDE